MKMKIYLRSIGITIFLCVFSAMIFAQTTEFTYQGRLNDTAGIAASYDFEFKLFSAPNAVNPLGTQTRPGIPVSGNVFTVQLDFGGQFDGAARYLEIAVKPAGSAGGYQQLLPRQPITSTPYSVRSLNSGAAVIFRADPSELERLFQINSIHAAEDAALCGNSPADFFNREIRYVED